MSLTYVEYLSSPSRLLVPYHHPQKELLPNITQCCLLFSLRWLDDADVFLFYFSFDRSCCLALLFILFTLLLPPSTPKRRLAARRMRDTNHTRPHAHTFHTHSSICTCNGCFTTIKSKRPKLIDAISSFSLQNPNAPPVHLFTCQLNAASAALG